MHCKLAQAKGAHAKAQGAHCAQGAKAAQGAQAKSQGAQPVKQAMPRRREQDFALGAMQCNFGNLYYCTFVFLEIAICTTAHLHSSTDAF